MQVTTLLNRCVAVARADPDQAAGAHRAHHPYRPAGARVPSPRELAAARHDVLPAAERERLAVALAGVTRRDPGRVILGGAPLAQVDGTTCGATVVLVTRAIVDPIYLWWLTRGHEAQVAARLAAEQRRIHAYANQVWPRRLGITPWGMVAALNGRVAPPGVRYGWRMVDDTDPASVGAVLRDAVAALEAGQVVPVLVGNSYPRHWVLLTGLRRRDGQVGELVFYNPSGSVVRVPVTDFVQGRSSGLGFPHAQAMVVPRPS